MNISKLLKIVNKIFPGSVIVDFKGEQCKKVKVSPSEAGRILAACKKFKKKSGQADKNQLSLF